MGVQKSKTSLSKNKKKIKKNFILKKKIKIINSEFKNKKFFIF